MTALYDIPLQTIDGAAATLAAYRGKVLLIVNVASACGLTPQYAGLEAAYEKYRGQGLEVLGFPCNDFGAQEPGTHEEIKRFCDTRFKVQFPLFAKLSVKTGSRHPLYQQLITAQPQAQYKPGSDFREKLAGYGIKQENPSDVLWNFEKFLISRSGAVVGRFAPDTAPDEPLLVQAIEAELAKG
ncbi:glutathione peroxidase [Solimonas aquatica]|uniref:Glutathione peroxidase n=1 Tax=Solimonas aquatica TaxID=489703 RepID=A0A1H9E397_9GAMM|nr:glutathione peroxidase [Solimonas aquatica]SEQ20239.1 glutathione peroxidase [Solimonas aquatica]